MNHIQDELKLIQNGIYGEATTYLDTLYHHLNRSKIDISALQKFTKYLVDEEYCTDAVDYDINIDDGLDGNISKYVDNETCVKCIIAFMSSSRRMFMFLMFFLPNKLCIFLFAVSFSSFSIGLRFYYWTKYQDLQVLNTGSLHNNIDHLGYKPCELYVEQKTSSMKEEMLEYEYLSIHQYNTEILPKATVYFNTNYAKKITAKGIKQYNNDYVPPYYGIRRDSLLSLSHFISIILYTDYDKLSADFSSTFRKINAFETLQHVKERNAKYWWMSKLLRETVEIFGDCSSTMVGGNLFGPFYSGLSVVINISNFFLRLSSPTSTSVHLEVAMRFSGADGIILKLNNPKDNNQCRYLRGFDCSMISRYKEEDERHVFYHLYACVNLYVFIFTLYLPNRLFFGGFWYIKLESIYVTKTSRNFNKIISALSYFDAMISGAQLQGYQIKDEQFRLLNNLIEFELSNYDDTEDTTTNNKKMARIKTVKHVFTTLFPKKHNNNNKMKDEMITFDPYIISIFKSFIKAKKDITINYHYLDDWRVNKNMVGLIMHKMEKNKDYQITSSNDDKKNLFKPKLLRLFKNVKSVTLITNSVSDNYGSYRLHRSLSIKVLLSMIKFSPLSNIFIFSYGSSNSWQSYLWETSSYGLINEFKKSNYEIQLKYKMGAKQEYHGFVISQK